MAAEEEAISIPLDLHVRSGDVLECLVRNNVDDGADDGAPIVDDFCQEGLQPSLCALAVRVKEGEHATLGVLGAQQPEAKKISRLRQMKRPSKSIVKMGIT